MKIARTMGEVSIELGSVICKDESGIYNDLPFAHDSVNHSAGEYVWDDAHTNGMESV